ncbi:glycosyltransferase family 2 protein [Allokutzneria sp. A3M-2-11 16]|uniref:glycosyltransferase family 2 protein n=1 Tax=Allokutzneria sp. A3M-2-11 16 TaxID=2962043 RepID=UPI0020B84388|nr:glycosyltransferase family 2 protein [Allokutzneria sp. A3M-2-11 16]MCP3799578.1 glycosyltransferase family 2 protein [Allokutzneria sp. A3M-2-11 16]
MPTLSVLVPAKDEQDTITELVRQLHESLDPRFDWEVVFVDDGSADRSWQVMSELAAADDRVRALRLRCNMGKAAALAVAIREARGDLLVTMDADLQDDPAEVPRLLARLEDGTDLVSGHKKDRKDPLSKRLPSKFFNTVTGWVTGLRLRDHNCGLKAGRREVFTTIPIHGELHRYVPALAHAMGFRVGEEPVHHRAREHGRSKYGFERYLRGALDLLTVVALTRYGRRPGHLFGGLGALSGLVGTMILLYLTGVWAFTDQSIGTRPLLTLGVLLEILAVQLVGLGLIAELVLARTLQSEEVERYVVDRTTPGPDR